jgi:CBS domain containing-hemolysin-like protein
MPDSNPPSTSEPTATTGGARNLPVPVPLARNLRSNSGENWLLRVLRAWFGWKSDSLHADLRSVLELRGGESSFSPRESAMLRNILALRERRAEDVMVPRADIIAVQQDIPLGELLKVFESAGHSRLVVYDEALDDAIGMVHIRDLIAYMTTHASRGAKANTRRKKPLPAGLDLKAIDLATPLSAAKIVRAMLFVPPSMPVMDLLARMQTSRIHLALIVDDYGGADGVVSIEDIMEQIVGEIADEHDEDEAPSVVRQADASFLADARAQLDDVTTIVGPEFDVGDVADEVDTLAGYITVRIGRVPVRGEIIPGPGRFEIEVLDADPRRVKKLKIYLNVDRKDGRSRELSSRPHGIAAGSPVPPELPISRDTSVKLSPDDSPSKAPRRQ